MRAFKVTMIGLVGLLLSGALSPAVYGASSPFAPQVGVDRLGDGSYCLELQQERAAQVPPPSGPALQFGKWQDIPRYLCSGQKFFSPSGVYTAMLSNNAGELIVARGDPTIPANVAWRGGGFDPGGSEYYLALDNGLSDNGALLRIERVDTTANSQSGYQIWRSNLFQPANHEAFLRLTDEGVLEVLEGLPTSPGKVLWTNGFKEPVKEIIFNYFDYDLAHMTTTKGAPVTGAEVNCNNGAPTPNTCQLTAQLNYSKTHSFSFAFKQAVNVKAITGLKVPFLVEGKLEVQVGLETTEQWSDSETESKTYTAQVSVQTPGKSVYKAFIAANKVLVSVPYSYAGIATYASGKKAEIPKVPLGVWIAENAYSFDIVIACVSTPGGCDKIPQRRIPVAPNARGVLGPISQGGQVDASLRARCATVGNYLTCLR